MISPMARDNLSEQNSTGPFALPPFAARAREEPTGGGPFSPKGVAALAGDNPSPAKGGPISQKLRCRLAECSGPGFTHEMSCLLRVRLRLAILIVLIGLAFYFLFQLLLPGGGLDHRPAYLLFCGFEIAVMSFASVLLWSRRA